MGNKTACLDCVNFQYQKGWKVAHCIENHLIDDSGKKRIFKDTVGGAPHGKGGSLKLVKRGKWLKVLNKPCAFWIDDITLKKDTINFVELFNIIKRIA